MKKIGRGWQYTVYDIGNNRVLKRWNNRSVAYLEMLRSCFPYVKNPIWKFPYYYKASISTATNSLRRLKNVKVEQKFFGNPSYTNNNLDYEQDKLLPVSIYFENNLIEENRLIIDKFVEFNKILIENRCIDKSFNIGKNFSLDKDNEIVLTDIGELYFTTESIQKQIDKKAWSAYYVLKTIPKNLREYFLYKMEILSSK